MEFTGEVIQRTAEGVVLLGAAAAAVLKRKGGGIERVVKSCTSEIKELYRVHSEQLAEQRRDELKPLEEEVKTVSTKVGILVERQEVIGKRIDKLEAEGGETRQIVVRLETAMGNHDDRAKETRVDFNKRLDGLTDRLERHIERA